MCESHTPNFQNPQYFPNLTKRYQNTSMEIVNRKSIMRKKGDYIIYIMRTRLRETPRRNACNSDIISPTDIADK